MNRVQIRDGDTGDSTGRWFDMDAAEMLAEVPAISGGEQLYRTRQGNFIMCYGSGDGIQAYEWSVGEIAEWCISNNISESISPEVDAAIEGLEI